MLLMMFAFSFLVGRKNLVCQEHKKSADENSEHEENYMLKIEKLYDIISRELRIKQFIIGLDLIHDKTL